MPLISSYIETCNTPFIRYNTICQELFKNLCKLTFQRNWYKMSLFISEKIYYGV